MHVDLPESEVKLEDIYLCHKSFLYFISFHGFFCLVEQHIRILKVEDLKCAYRSAG